MEYNFLDSSIDVKDFVLPNSDKINSFLLKNNTQDIFKALDFLSSEGKFMYIHGFLGTGKRQFVNYVTEFLSSDVIKLEYYCKTSTVCDDVLLSFIDIIEKNPLSKAVNINTKISTLAVKFQQYISSIKKPFVIVLHSFDDVLAENVKLLTDCLSGILKNSNVKIVISTRAMIQDILGEVSIDRKIFLKPFSKDIFKEFLISNNISCTDTTLEDFYKYTRGYYYYTALCIKIINAMKISLNEFLEKFTLSGMNFDSFIGATYLNLIPNTIRNFFWFIRTVRHGLTLNALAVFELYDEFSIEYLKNNLMIFQSDETIYVHDYFQQNIDISIPSKTEIKLHKYIIGIYEKQLKEPLKTREIMISRQALRAEIDYHANCIKDIEEGKKPLISEEEKPIKEPQKKPAEPVTQVPSGIGTLIENAKKLVDDKNYTDAIEAYLKILEQSEIDLHTIAEIRLALARLYKEIADYQKAKHYYELNETFYKNNSEVINLNYLYYELTDLYFLMYKNERAIETIKKVIYSVDTPQSLMVSACTLLGNIYSSINNPDEAYTYYQKALESLNENTTSETLAELYFKYALAQDDRNDVEKAFEYYTKCIMINDNNPYKSIAYSNMASCYFDNENYSDAKECFLKAYEIEKTNNNYDGIYYTTSYLAKIYIQEKHKRALNFLLEAKHSAEFINEEFYILEATLELGDYYYNNISLNKKALTEYFKAKKVAQNLAGSVDISIIERRIQDMKLRMDVEIFTEIEKKYG